MRHASMLYVSHVELFLVQPNTYAPLYRASQRHMPMACGLAMCARRLFHSMKMEWRIVKSALTTNVPCAFPCADGLDLGVTPLTVAELQTASGDLFGDSKARDCHIIINLIN